ncbi:MAG: hypothetical protein AVDCRST_MAG73-140 [uncultured Thermomicrobiales bacterium]|uniref:Methyltransferase type 11 domain-containing protein n=1 Tax=uncultured Thermomicrobiales bacterium TaxID=1645740 RepID=A0A6J4TDA4_9BACT|nr:MAG: hypothetical protein AVDCRST_MAG73-140 [uncultured Thermomicrobiales bacterium]
MPDDRRATQTQAQTQWLDRVRATWAERAPWWDAMSETNAVSPDRTDDLRRTASALRLGDGATLLDAGCGTGQFALGFAAMGCRVVGVDLAPEMIERARGHAAARGLDVEFRVGDLGRLPDPDGTFAAVHARLALQFVPDLAGTLAELRRVLAPGGRLYAAVPGALSPIYDNAWRRLLNPDRGAINYAVPWELERVLEELGWTVVDGWGHYGAALSGEGNRFSAESVAGLDKRLQQAAATSWAVVAE